MFCVLCAMATSKRPTVRVHSCIAKKRFLGVSRFSSAFNSNTQHDLFSPPPCWWFNHTGRPLRRKRNSKFRRVGASNFNVAFSLVYWLISAFILVPMEIGMIGTGIDFVTKDGKRRLDEWRKLGLVPLCQLRRSGLDFVGDCDWGLR